MENFNYWEMIYQVNHGKAKTMVTSSPFEIYEKMEELVRENQIVHLRVIEMKGTKEKFLSAVKKAMESL